MRLDLFLLQCGLAPSRAKAQELIRHGDVEVRRGSGWRVESSPAAQIEEDAPDQVRLTSQEILKYVSRGGLKLEAALDHVQLDVAGAVVLDIGISTGGFADCLLQRGAANIVGIDVGSGQLAERLRQDSRVRLFEGVNIRDISEQKEIAALLVDVDLCVIDVSFISLALVLPKAAAALPRHRLLALIKPQFELSAADLSKNGVVKDTASQERAIGRVRTAATASGYKIHAVFPSAWKGGEGNQEFFLFAESK